MKIKMYCIFARESIDKMKGIRGKMCTQAGHAYLHGFWDSAKRFPEHAQAYVASDHAYKITLIVPTVSDLEQLFESYKDKCGVTLVKDAGFTVFNEPTVTCLGIGPIPEDLIGEDLKTVKTFT
jgi:peptidyl-tRNA hydrolase